MNSTQGIRIAVALVVAAVVAVLAAGYVVWWLQQAPTLVGEAERAGATQLSLHGVGSLGVGSGRERLR